MVAETGKLDVPAWLDAAPVEQRKTVTVLFCDVTGSTELGESIDPEALRGLLARYFERMQAIVDSHGGRVEKFIGDAVMAVFGVPAAHEDDALRACRAAVEMREALPGLREALPAMRLVLAAMGPRMSAFGGAEWDGVFFNWMTPAFAASAHEQVETGAREAGRETPPVFGYVRTAVGPDATERLAKEESFYRDLHDGYRNHFARLAEAEGTVGVAAADATAAQSALAAYEALDTIVVRGLASARVETMSAVAEAAAP